MVAEKLVSIVQNNVSGRVLHLLLLHYITHEYALQKEQGEREKRLRT